MVLMAVRLFGSYMDYAACRRSELRREIHSNIPCIICIIVLRVCAVKSAFSFCQPHWSKLVTHVHVGAYHILAYLSAERMAGRPESIVNQESPSEQRERERERKRYDIGVGTHNKLR